MECLGAGPGAPWPAQRWWRVAECTPRARRSRERQGDDGSRSSAVGLISTPMRHDAPWQAKGLWDRPRGGAARAYAMAAGRTDSAAGEPRRGDAARPRTAAGAGRLGIATPAPYRRGRAERADLWYCSIECISSDSSGFRVVEEERHGRRRGRVGAGPLRGSIAAVGPGLLRVSLLYLGQLGDVRVGSSVRMVGPPRQP